MDLSAPFINPSFSKLFLSLQESRAVLFLLRCTPTTVHSSSLHPNLLFYYYYTYVHDVVDMNGCIRSLHEECLPCLACSWPLTGVLGMLNFLYHGTIMSSRAREIRPIEWKQCGCRNSFVRGSPGRFLAPRSRFILCQLKCTPPSHLATSCCDRRNHRVRQGLNRTECLFVLPTIASKLVIVS